MSPRRRLCALSIHLGQGRTNSRPSGRLRLGLAELRQFRRPEDPFVYDAVTVPRFEEAVAGVVLNADVQAVIIKDNFRFRYQFDTPMLRLAARVGFSDSPDPEDPSVRICHLRL